MSPSTPARPPYESLRPPMSSRPPPDISGAASEVVRRLRAEVAATTDKGRQARLLGELAEVEERVREEGAAARDYLSAYQADPTFREALEGLARLLEKRSSPKSLGRLFEALVDASATPDERVRALLMRANYEADVAGDVAAGQATVLAATEVEGASFPEQAVTWLTLEVLAARVSDEAARQRALASRADCAADATWRGLLLIDRARMAAASGDEAVALQLLEEVRSGDSEAVWTATAFLEQVLRDCLGRETPEERERAGLRCGVLEAIAGLVHASMVDGNRGDQLGVPLAVRDPARAVDAWLRAAEGRRALGQIDAAASALNRALFLVDRIGGDDGRLAEAAVAQARIRLAEQTGDTALAAQLAARRLATEPGGSLAAALALRVAEHAAAEGDAASAVEALEKAIASDPGCLPARALQLDILADRSDVSAFAEQLEAFADHLSTDEARGRAFLLAATLWSLRAHDVSAAKAALAQAAMFGVPSEVICRVARTLASIASESTWYEEATRRLLTCEGLQGEAVALSVELLRLRDAREDADGAARVLRDLREMPRGGWIARVLEAFSPGPGRTTPDADFLARSRTAVEELAENEKNAESAAALSMVAAMRAHAHGDREGARVRLRQLASQYPDDASVAAFAIDLDRSAGDRTAARDAAALAASSVIDPTAAAAFHFEAAFDDWTLGHKSRALEHIESAAAGAPDAARLLLGWAAWGVAPESVDGRRRALQEAEAALGDPRVLALERFANEVAVGEIDVANDALDAVDDGRSGTLSVAAALARAVWPRPNASSDVTEAAFARIAELGPRSALFAAAERVRVARDRDDADAYAQSACAWFDAGGGLAASLEWLSASTLLGDARQEMQARLAAAAALPGEGGEALLASAALLQTRIEVDRPAPLAAGDSAAVRLANLELGPPGCDPRRRAAVLRELDGALGDDAALDAIGLSAWSLVAASKWDDASTSFTHVVEARPSDVSAWEGLRLCAERLGNHALQAKAASELGARCKDASRGAAFWEQAARLWLEVGDDEQADAALDASFARDATRPIAFDMLFRRVRDRKDHAKLLAVIARRLEVCDESDEIQKLFWEQARTLRAIGDQDGALKALEHVTMLEPDHVGALALLGEINLRRGQFEEAATALARLAQLESAPAKNRATAGVAAVDIYENKLSRFDRGLEVLLALHRAKLSTLPVRERLGRAAARIGAWSEATGILEELMLERPDSAGRAEAARLALAIHRDKLHQPAGAAAAVAKLLDELPTDGEALDMLRETTHPDDVRVRLLVNARAGLGRWLQVKPTDVTALRRLAFIAQSLHDDALQQAALAVVSALGEGDATSEQLLAQLSAKKLRTPKAPLSSAMVQSMIAPGEKGPQSDLFAILAPTLAAAVGPNLQSLGVGRRDKVDPRAQLALRTEIAAWANAFGIPEFELYVGGSDPLGIQGIPGTPPSLVVGAGVNAPLGPLTRARVARELFGILRGTTVALRQDDATLAAITSAASRLADVDVSRAPSTVVSEMEKRIGKVLPRKTRKLLPDVCRAMGSRTSDPSAWRKEALASFDRIATVASGDPGLVLSDALNTPLEDLSKILLGHPRAEDLLRFVLSQAYIDVRRALGLESTS